MLTRDFFVGNPCKRSQIVGTGVLDCPKTNDFNLHKMAILTPFPWDKIPYKDSPRFALDAMSLQFESANKGFLRQNRVFNTSSVACRLRHMTPFPSRGRLSHVELPLTMCISGLYLFPTRLPWIVLILVILTPPFRFRCSTASNDCQMPPKKSTPRA